MYLDGYLLVVPKKNMKAYEKMAKDAGKIWKKYGALRYVETAGDDMNSFKEMGGMTFPQVIKAKKGEIVWFSFVIYKSRKHRDVVNKKVHAYMEKKYADKMNEPMPFDMKRLAMGGFDVMVDLK